MGGARRTDLIAPPVTALELDVTDPASCERFVRAANEELSGLDILVNAAGLALGRDPFDNSTEEDERLVLETNVNGLIRMTRLCLPHLRDGGHIVHIGSVAGRQAYEKGSLYITSKFAVRGFTYALREDLLGRPIRITTVDPGLTQTEFSLVRFKGDEERAAAVYRGVDPLRPEDIAECIVFALTRPWHVNVDEVVVKARNQSSGGRILRDRSLQPLQIPERIARRAEEDRPHVVIHAHNFMSLPVEMLDRFRTNQSTAAGDQNFHPFESIPLPMGRYSYKRSGFPANRIPDMAEIRDEWALPH